MYLDDVRVRVLSPVSDVKHMLTKLADIRYDAPFHLSEECSNANIASPRAIVMTAQFGLYMGWAIILVNISILSNRCCADY